MNTGDPNPIQLVTSRCGQAWERLEPLCRRVRERFGVDTRSLAAFRIALGLILLFDLLHRAGDMRLFYTDYGAYPVASYEVTYSQYTGYSLHAFSGDVWFQQLLFVVAGCFALGFLVGYRTRLTGVVSLVLLFSLQARNPAVLNSADILLRHLLVLGLLAPIGERWSVDALRRGRARTRVATVGTAAVLLQPIVVFTTNAILKHQGEHWYAGEALEIAMLNDAMRYYVGNLIVEYSGLMTVLNYAWIAMLAGSILFLLLTVGRVRTLATVAYISAFVGMLLTMAVGLFPAVLVTSVIPFLTAHVWDLLARPVPSHWSGALPDREQLGRLGRPPIEQRLLTLLRDRGYTAVAAYPRSLLTVLGIMAIAWMLVFSAAGVTAYDVPEGIDNTHLDQQAWSLYAPDPSEGYSWYVTEAELTDGTTVDAVSGGPVEFDRPADGSEAYETFRHRKFMNLVRNSADGDTDPAVVEAYAAWACNRTAATQDRPVATVTVYRFYQSSPIDGEYDEPSRRTLIEHDCSRQ